MFGVWDITKYINMKSQVVWSVFLVDSGVIILISRLLDLECAISHPSLLCCVPLSIEPQGVT